MSILVTGAHGFLGKHLCNRLKEISDQSIVMPTHSQYDLTDQKACDKLFETYRPQLVIHAAALVGGIGANNNNPGSFFYQNALMGMNVIEMCRRYNVRKVVVLGTVCSYPSVTPVPFQESSLWDGYPESTNAPYGLAKRMLLVMCQAYRKQYALDGVMVLPANLYGPEDNFNPVSSHVIPAMIRKFVQAVDHGIDKVELWGDGTATREFLYVADAVEGIIKAAKSYSGSDPINLGTGVEISIEALAKSIADITGFQGELVWNRELNGQLRRTLDTSRAAYYLGWRASTTLYSGLKTTIDWYRQNLHALSV